MTQSRHNCNNEQCDAVTQSVKPKGAKIKKTKEQNCHTAVPSAWYSAKLVSIFKNNRASVPNESCSFHVV